MFSLPTSNATPRHRVELVAEGRRRMSAFYRIAYGEHNERRSKDDDNERRSRPKQSVLLLSGFVGMDFKVQGWHVDVDAHIDPLRFGRFLLIYCNRLLFLNH